MRDIPRSGIRRCEIHESGGDKDEVDLRAEQSRKGTFQFNAKGIAASDITTDQRVLERERAISIGKTSYLSGGMWKNKLPEGKTWYKTGGLPSGGGGFHGQVINPAEPKTLAALVKKGRLSGSTLTFNAAGLVSRVRSSYAATGVLDTNGYDGKTITVDSRFTGWGVKVSIKPPNPGTVSTKTSE
ncbi:hypothetical protein [Nonomuraea solani]|nr:hypothetical protein [Nonomuraea solani]